MSAQQWNEGKNADPILKPVPDMISAAKKAAVAAEADMEEKEAPAAAGSGGSGGGGAGEGKGDDGDAEIRESLVQGKKKMTSFLGQRNRFRYIEGRPSKRFDTAYDEEKRARYSATTN